MNQNFTPIDDIIQKYQSSQQQGVSSIPVDSTYKLKQPEQVSHSKEFAPPGKSLEILPTQETITVPEVGVDLEQFVEVKQETIKIDPELKKMGLQPMEKTKFKEFQNIKLPLSDDKIAKGLHEPITSSIRWLATFALFLLQQSHLTLKVVHGKAVRVFKK